jgi:hypothetical protein
VRQALANTILTEYHNSGDQWSSAMNNLDALLALRPSPDVSGPGFFSDGDMLHTCTFGKGKKGPGMKQYEYDAQLSTYAVLASPIIISADLRTLKQTQPECLKLLTNTELLSVHQDPKAFAPRIVFEHRINGSSTLMARDAASVVTAQGFARTMHDSSIALVLLNRKDRGNSVLAVTWSQLGIKTGVTCSVRDILRHQDLGQATSAFNVSVAPHSAAFVRLKC